MRLGRGLCIVASIAALVVVTACSSSGSKTGAGPASSSADSQSASASVQALLPDAVRKAGTITFAIQQHPPFTTIAGNNASGPAIDLQNALAAVMGLKVTTSVVAGGLPPVLSGMLSGRYAAFNGPVEASSDREKQYDIVSYMTQYSAYVVTKQHAASSSDAGQLCGQTVAYVTSTVQQAYESLAGFCKTAGKAAPKLLNVDNTNDSILAVKSGRAYAAGISSAAADDAVRHDNALASIHQTAQQGLVLTNYGVVLPKKPGLGQAMFAAMKVLFADGTVKRILQKYGLAEGIVKKPQLNPPPTTTG